MSRQTRKTSVFRRVYSPIKHTIMAGKESIRAVSNTASNVACDGLTGLDRIGSSVARHANMAVNDLIGSKSTRRRGKTMRRGRGKKISKR